MPAEQQIIQPEGKQQTKQQNQIQCPKCHSKILVKKGIRKKQASISPAVPMQRMQVYLHTKQIKKHNLSHYINPKSHLNI